MNPNGTHDCLMHLERRTITERDEASFWDTWWECALCGFKLSPLDLDLILEDRE